MIILFAVSLIAGIFMAFSTGLSALEDHRADKRLVIITLVLFVIAVYAAMNL